MDRGNRRLIGRHRRLHLEAEPVGGHRVQHRQRRAPLARRREVRDPNLPRPHPRPTVLRPDLSLPNKQILLINQRSQHRQQQKLGQKGQKNEIFCLIEFNS